GNVDTRIRKALDANGIYDAIVLAYAGLERLGRLDVVAEVLDRDLMLPAPGQGALAIQCRDDKTSMDVVRTINDEAGEIAVAAERGFLAGLGGGCALPICCLGTVAGEVLELRGRVLSPDGSQRIDVSVRSSAQTAAEARETGNDLAQNAIGKGAADLLGMQK
ncbi:MAG: hydroxymethylbilane synthase, partial [Candidatus Latescibacterota bacterium]